MAEEVKLILVGDHWPAKTKLGENIMVKLPADTTLGQAAPEIAKLLGRDSLDGLQLCKGKGKAPDVSPGVKLSMSKPVVELKSKTAMVVVYAKEKDEEAAEKKKPTNKIRLLLVGDDYKPKEKASDNLMLEMLKDETLEARKADLMKLLGVTSLANMEICKGRGKSPHITAGLAMDLSRTPESLGLTSTAAFVYVKTKKAGEKPKPKEVHRGVYQVGAKVELQDEDTDEWVKGTVTMMRNDGSYDVTLDAGTVEKYVDTDDLRVDQVCEAHVRRGTHTHTHTGCGGGSSRRAEGSVEGRPAADSHEADGRVPEPVGAGDWRNPEVERIRSGGTIYLLPPPPHAHALSLNTTSTLYIPHYMTPTHPHPHPQETRKLLKASEPEKKAPAKAPVEKVKKEPAQRYMKINLENPKEELGISYHSAAGKVIILEVDSGACLRAGLQPCHLIKVGADFVSTKAELESAVKQIRSAGVNQFDFFVDQRPEALMYEGCVVDVKEGDDRWDRGTIQKVHTDDEDFSFDVVLKDGEVEEDLDIGDLRIVPLDLLAEEAKARADDEKRNPAAKKPLSFIGAEVGQLEDKPTDAPPNSLPDHSGVMQKKGDDLFGLYKPRRFALYGTSLYYYKPNAKTPMGVLDLRSSLAMEDKTKGRVCGRCVFFLMFFL